MPVSGALIVVVGCCVSAMLTFANLDVGIPGILMPSASTAKIETPRIVRPPPRPDSVTQLAFRYRERSVGLALGVSGSRSQRLQWSSRLHPNPGDILNARSPAPSSACHARRFDFGQRVDGGQAVGSHGYRIYTQDGKVWLSFERPGDPSVRGKRELL